MEAQRKLQRAQKRIIIQEPPPKNDENGDLAEAKERFQKSLDRFELLMQNENDQDSEKRENLQKPQSDPCELRFNFCEWHSHEPYST